MTVPAAATAPSASTLPFPGVRAWPLWLLLWLPIQASAAQVLGVHVARHGSHFLIRMQFVIDALPPAVFRALRDYTALPRYTPDLLAVLVDPTAQPDQVRLRLTIRACVLMFCKLMHPEQIITATARADGGVLAAERVPDSADFKRASGRWTVAACRTDRARTCMNVRIELEPAFWVPPLIGPWLIRRKLAEEGQRSSSGLEQLARALPSP